MSAESLVLVEGFDDRDFWKGLLVRNGCKDARNEAPTSHRYKAAFTYRTPAGPKLHVVPYKATGYELPALAGLVLRERANRPLRRLVLSPDADAHPTVEAARAGVRSVVVGACPDAKETTDGAFLVDDGKVVVSTVLLHAAGARGVEGRLPDGVPAQRALEQLACAALSAVYPERGGAVAAWLSSRPAPHGKEHKAHAWSFYAGWATDHGTGDFYGSLWQDEAVAAELAKLLRAQEAWRVIEDLLQG